jgi:hypothetical protein
MIFSTLSKNIRAQSNQSAAIWLLGLGDEN